MSNRNVLLFSWDKKKPYPCPASWSLYWLNSTAVFSCVLELNKIPIVFFYFLFVFICFFFPSCSANVLFFLPWQNDLCRLLLPALIITCTIVPSSDMWPVDSTAAEKNHNLFSIYQSQLDWVWRRCLLFDMNLIYGVKCQYFTKFKILTIKNVWL